MKVQNLSQYFFMPYSSFTLPVIFVYGVFHTPSIYMPKLYKFTSISIFSH